ncbi:hypothetical protein LTR85_000691 [Meristemomyces frigidus]|nr:hypothetical protein LTR85_000691 [Meristemomyces frigidus]
MTGIGSRCTAVWIDALCINQEDMLEKSHQVAMMADIYQRASLVYACLGPHCDDSDFLFEQLATCSEHINVLTEKARIETGAAWDERPKSRKIPVGEFLRQEVACADPRDRIYSMLKITYWPQGLSPVMPDYSKTAFELAREIMAYHPTQDAFSTDFGLARTLMTVLQVADNDPELVKLLYSRQQAPMRQSADLRNDCGEEGSQRGLSMRLLGRHGRLRLRDHRLLSAPFEIIENVDGGTKW